MTIHAFDPIDGAHLYNPSPRLGGGRQPKRSMDRTLLRLGFVLVLLALLTGLGVPAFANPRLGLSAHTAGLLGGLFLVVLGAVWPAFALGPRAAAALWWCWAYAAYANWAASVLGAVTGASRMTPLAGAATHGGAGAELAVGALLVSLSLAALAGAGLAVWGLREG
jgi:hydroxylaminobenzene mutase